MLTFTQKLFRQRSFFNCLIPLLALFVGLGTTSVSAQSSSTATLRNVIVTSGASASAATTNTYDAIRTSNATSPAPNNGIFDGTDFGTLDVNSGSLLLQGGSIQIVEVGGDVFTSAFIDYGVAQGTFPNAPDPAFAQSLQLTQMSYDAATKTRTFSLNGAGRNILALAVANGTGTSHRFDIAVRAIGANGRDQISINGSRRESVFTPTSAAPTVSTATLRNVIITSGTTAASATINTYDANTSTPGPGVFNGTNFGILDVNAGRLLLQGGAIQIAEKNGDRFDQAEIAYVVTPGTFSTSPASFALGQKLPLTVVSYDAATMTRTFTLSNAARNILALATTTGAPGTSYRFDVAVSATGENGGNPIGLLGNRQTSVFFATGVPTFQPTLTNTTVFISPNGGPNVSYDANNPPNANPFSGGNLGTFDIVTGKLVLNGGTAVTRENGTNEVSNVTLYYRVRRSGTGGGGFIPLTLTQTSTINNADGSRTRNFSLSSAAQNLLSAVTIVGGYNVDVYLEASGADNSNNTNFVAQNGSSISPYTASFTVNGTPIVTTIWTGGKNDNWFDPANWTNGVPTAITNAIIPNFTSGTGIPYPNIYSDAIKPFTAERAGTDAAGNPITIPADPGYNNIGSGNAMVRNLTLQGNSQLDRSILRLVVGRLDVFGDFTNPYGSFIQRSSPIISFKADGNQNISGSINGFSNVEIDGGVNSIKSLINNFEIKAGGYLKFIHGILKNTSTDVSTNFISFEGSLTDPSTRVVTPAAQLLGETENTFYFGYLKTTQAATIGVPQSFSNIGLTLTFSGVTQPGNVFVTRNNSDNYPSTAFGSSPPKNGIRRVFGVQPGVSTGLVARLEFRYLSNELVNLRNPDGTFTGSVDQNKLSLFISTTGGNTFLQLGRDSNSGNILVKNNVTQFNTFTLSEQIGALPLPVTLVAFDAKRVGADALVTWQTATELNNKGYNVQVSTDGKGFHTIGTITSASPNSTKATNYSFTDTEKNKYGVRYYRLEQMDVDGKLNYFAPRGVSFDGKATDGANALAYPNPFTSDVQLNIASVSEGKGSVRINDMTGRLVAERQIELANGVNDVHLSNLGELKSGIYLVHVTLPTGEVKNLKVVKQ
ncbi:T9SS type A sorting domain-containing protein [Hymenobacter sp. BT770]|uniref:T9SS type A sorting domain-containing protein n=1 Tax=Hymenobacter sp. BT770 TaxID=2886942 RepID=UPI001D10E2E9|nr:T9SS type A sorting domain-containing protein [Hymenobacter sp. BT770]MCC3151934.1 T9SS type A sorting domain-containing protein [Hymenobacter sp. BT770]MDO3413443.1 T9SS type A sorting domain-containing protein [Hymenobacter sp. BT770]